MDTKKILIIDDNIQLSQIFDYILTKAGYKILCINEGTVALEGVVSFLPDLIILDIMMEPLTGWDILIEIRKQEDLRGIPVFMLTGKPLNFDEILSYGEIIDGYIVKPVDSKELIRIIRELFGLCDSVTQQSNELQAAKKDSTIISQYFQVQREKRSLESLLARINLQYASVEDEDLLISIEESKKKVLDKIKDKNQKEEELKIQLQ